MNLDRTPQSQAWESFPEAVPGGSGIAGTVLLVDDDSELRKAMREFLEHSGCRVLEARNTYDGLFLSAQHGPVIQLLITEINLLPVSGIKLAENVLRLCPQIQVLCMSESEEIKGVQHWMRYLGAEYLRKPFSPFDLHEKVHGLLRSRFEDATMPVLDVLAGPGTLPEQHSNNEQDPMFWLKEF
jgi:two-component system, chemotaxis family, chemotaxis protein CheY